MSLNGCVRSSLRRFVAWVARNFLVAVCDQDIISASVGAWWHSRKKVPEHRKYQNHIATTSLFQMRRIVGQMRVLQT